MKPCRLLPTNITLLLRNLIIAIIFSSLIVSCGDDSDSFITAQASSFTFNELNTCDIGGTTLATSFDFTIAYDASENTKIAKVLFDLEWSNGDSESSETTDFSDLGTRIEYDWCYRFGNDDWVEITHRIVTENDLTSNTSVIMVTRPEGAN